MIRRCDTYSVIETREFLEAFNDVEDALRVRTGKDRREEQFMGLVRSMGNHPIIRRFSKDLRRLAEVRNLLAHHSGPALIQVRETAVLTLRRIHQLLTRPPTVLEVSAPLLATCTHDTALEEAFDYMKKHEHAQLPVTRDKAMIGMLSRDSVFRWVTAHVEPAGVAIEAGRVGDLEPHFDQLKPHDLLSRSEEAFALYKRFGDAKRRLDRLFVTERGKIGECLLGVVTPHDLVKVDKYLE